MKLNIIFIMIIILQNQFVSSVSIRGSNRRRYYKKLKEQRIIDNLPNMQLQLYYEPFYYFKENIDVNKEVNIDILSVNQNINTNNDINYYLKEETNVKYYIYEFSYYIKYLILLVELSLFFILIYFIFILYNEYF